MSSTAARGWNCVSAGVGCAGGSSSSAGVATADTCIAPPAVVSRLESCSVVKPIAVIVEVPKVFWIIEIVKAVIEIVIVA
jgi:enoyl reductase-like protein